MRFRTLCGFSVALVLCACSSFSTTPESPGQLPPIVSTAATAADTLGVAAPATIADNTTMDEKGVVAIESTVALAADLATIAVNAHVVTDHATLERLRTAKDAARAGVQASRDAYRAGNAASWKAAIASINAAISDIRGLSKVPSQ